MTKYRLVCGNEGHEFTATFAEAKATANTLANLMLAAVFVYELDAVMPVHVAHVGSAVAGSLST